MLFDILLTLFLVLLNGFFVAAEFSIVKVRASQMELRAQAGSRTANMALHMINHLDSYLSATQLGITLASLGLGWIGESVVSQIIISLMDYAGFRPDPDLAHRIALPVAFAVITVLHIVFGELAPKSLAIQRAEATSMAVSFPMRFFHFVFSPFIWLLNGLSNAFLRSVGIRPVHGAEVHSAEELRLLFEQSMVGGAIQGSQHELLENVFQFNERMVKQIMVPRTKIMAINVETPEEDLLDLVFGEGYSRMPVYQGNIDNIIGVLYVKDLLVLIRRNAPIVLSELIRPAYFVPETKRINTLLKQFQRKHMHMAVVSDEFGGVSGLVTIEDIVEELVGEIQDEYDEEIPIVEKVSDTEFKVQTSAAISDVNDYLPYSLPKSDDYETVGGLINLIYGAIPDLNEIAVMAPYEFKVLEKSQRNIEVVLLRVMQSDEIIPVVEQEEE